MHPALYVDKSPIGGRGVYASRNIKEGEILERSPYIEDDFVKFIGVSRDYVFYKTADRKTAILSFGYASMYNHSDSPSAAWKINEDSITITATQNIKKGDEIFVSYGPGYWISRQDFKTKKELSDL
jgi:SET domain-containing protein